MKVKIFLIFFFLLTISKTENIRENHYESLKFLFQATNFKIINENLNKTIDELRNNVTSLTKEIEKFKLEIKEIQKKNRENLIEVFNFIEKVRTNDSKITAELEKLKEKFNTNVTAKNDEKSKNFKLEFWIVSGVLVIFVTFFMIFLIFVICKRKPSNVIVANPSYTMPAFNPKFNLPKNFKKLQGNESEYAEINENNSQNLQSNREVQNRNFGYDVPRIYQK